VADRWHVLKNLGEVVKRVLIRQQAQIEQAVSQLRAQQLGQPVEPSIVALPRLRRRLNTRGAMGQLKDMATGSKRSNHKCMGAPTSIC
jgi:hypothetical protein